MRLLELICDNRDKLSTPPAIVWVGVLVLSTQIIIDAVNGNTNETVIGIYATLIGGVYGLKKGFDSSVEKATVKATVPIPDINVSNIENAESLTESGDVNIKGKKKRK